MDENSIIAAARKLPAEHCAAYLDEACGGDSAMRARIENALAASGSFEDLPTMAMGVQPVADSPSDHFPQEPSKSDPSASQDSEMDQTFQTLLEQFTKANPDAQVPFVFGDRIAQGAMGAILEADDCKLGRKIAVKVMLSEAGMTDEQKLRFVQEAAVLGKLEHPNIVPIH
ncbi:MAG: protein kinase, partial [Verrucomicrobiales bacterium]|nr:protein kinase [Verrucomicrobiales bacterium]